MTRAPTLLLCAAAIAAATAARAPAGVAAPKKNVAVLYFDNHTGRADYDAVGQGIAAMLISDLSTVPEIQLVERERVGDLEQEMDKQHSKYYDSTTAVMMGHIVGAEYIVTGAVSAVQPQVRIDTRVIRVETGEIVKTAQATGQEDKFFDVETQMSHQLIDGLGIALSPEEQQQLAAQQEANRIDAMTTVVSFSQALAMMQHKDYVGAATHMQPVLQASPNSALVQATVQEIQKAAAARALEEAQKRTKGLLNGLFKPPGR
jgi:curli biogenesis system outer membrane secretion channel CsgG